jgi:hypothetical protein
MFNNFFCLTHEPCVLSLVAWEAVAAIVNKGIFYSHAEPDTE